ncbi:hypothetical protein [Methylobacterium sp. E-066]|nr:hypothetical protein [Methylobacterium sp. E-066]MCJ2139580.1 hypothetical protein [Methylobacterium sp. E-066]
MSDAIADTGSTGPKRSKGNVFTTEVDTGKRAQKFLAVGNFVLRKRVP